MDLSGRQLVDTPLDQFLFVDRSEELRRALASIDRRSNVLISGARGIGKTSLLHRLEHELRGRGYQPTFVDAVAASSVPDLIDLARWRLGNQPVMAPIELATRQVGGQEVLGEAARLTRLLATLAEGVSAD